MRARIVGVVALTVALCATVSAQDLKFTALGGGAVNLNLDQSAETKVTPFAQLGVEAALAEGAERSPVLHVQVELSALPGETLDLTTPETFRAVNFRLGLEQRLATKLNFSLYGECGFTTRLDGDTAPRDRAPRWCGGGVLFKNREGTARLKVTLNADQRLASAEDTVEGVPVLALRYQPTVEVSGRVSLWTAESRGGGATPSLSLVGTAVLGLDLTRRFSQLSAARHDSINVGIAVGI